MSKNRTTILPSNFILGYISVKKIINKNKNLKIHMHPNLDLEKDLEKAEEKDQIANFAVSLFSTSSPTFVICR